MANIDLKMAVTTDIYTYIEVLWMLPWAIFMATNSVSKSQPWTYYAIIFGGALVFDFFDVGLTLLLWVFRLHKGNVKARDTELII